MQEFILFLVRVQCRRKESSRSLSHLLMSFLLYFCKGHVFFIKLIYCLIDWLIGINIQEVYVKVEVYEFFTKKKTIET